LVIGCVWISQNNYVDRETTDGVARGWRRIVDRGMWPSTPSAIEALRRVFRVSERTDLLRRRIVQPADH
jgi:hypothetical protein